MNTAHLDALAMVGDAADPAAWSGISAHFLAAARRQSWPLEAWRVDLARLAGPRRWWNLGQVLRGRRPGGYQFSEEFLTAAEAQVPPHLKAGRVLCFHQQFPRAASVTAQGGQLYHYLDATFASFCLPGGQAAGLPAVVRARACQTERENLQASARIVTMARWAADAVTADCGVPRGRVATILPGANLELPADYDFPVAAGWPGRDRPLVLGFVGKDWRRKGLPFLLEVRHELARRGIRAEVRCAGRAPRELARRAGVSFVGFIDKRRQADEFLHFLAGCDVGCLFSSHEPLGISTLEFLRAGVPVAGFAVEGLLDTLPPDAGFRFAPSTRPAAVAETLQAAFADAGDVAARRAAARRWSELVTWDRCLREWSELLATGDIRSPVQLWREPVGAGASTALATP